MGCCLSHPQGPDAPYSGSGGAASASERAITAPSVGGRSSFVSGPVSVPPAPAAAASAAVSASHADAAHANSDSDATMASSLSVAAAAARSQPRDAHLLAVVPSSSSSSVPAHPASQQQQQPSLAQHLNKPLRRPHRWSMCNHPWSRQAIDRERIDFFDTRVTGRIEIWQTLRVVLQLQWEAERGGGDAAAAEEARATAQTILDAAAITLPTGDLTQGAYDVFGNFYDLPAWIVSDPTNLVEEEEEDDDDDEIDENDPDDEDGDGDDEGEDSDPKSALDEQQRRRRSHGDVADAADIDGSDTLSSDDDDADDDDDVASRRREEKGKAVLNVDDHPRHRPTITVRARLSLTGHDVVLRVPRDALVRSIAHQVAARAQLPPDATTHRVRLAYMGRLLKEGQSLPAQGWQEGHVVNALVFGVAG